MQLAEVQNGVICGKIAVKPPEEGREKGFISHSGKFARIKNLHPKNKTLLPRQPSNNLGNENNCTEQHELDDDKRHYAAINVPRFYFGGGNAFQVKKRKTKGRREERGLQVHGNQNGNPKQVHVITYKDWRYNRHKNKDNFYEINEKACNENRYHYKNQKGIRAQIGLLNELHQRMVAPQTTKCKPKGRCSHEDNKHHASEVGRFAHDFL